MNTDLQKPNHKKKIYRFVALSLVLHSLAGASMLIISSLANKISVQQLNDGSSASGGTSMVLDLDTNLNSGDAGDTLSATPPTSEPAISSAPKEPDSTAIPSATISAATPMEVQKESEKLDLPVASKPTTQPENSNKKLPNKTAQAKESTKTKIPPNKSQPGKDKHAPLLATEDEKIKSVLADSSSEIPRLEKADETPESPREETDNSETEALAAFRAQADESARKTGPSSSQRATKPTTSNPSNEDDDQSDQQANRNQAKGSGEALGTASAAAGPVGIVRDGDDLIEADGNQIPHYPVQDRLANREGTVVFLAKVEEDGSLSEIRFLKRNPSASLNSSAANAFKKYKYLPGQQGWIRKTFTFNLHGEAEEIPGKLKRE